jgi:hypothetical protein
MDVDAARFVDRLVDVVDAHLWTITAVACAVGIVAFTVMTWVRHGRRS